jgi:hypothetical protein
MLTVRPALLALFAVALTVLFAACNGKKTGTATHSATTQNAHGSCADRGSSSTLCIQLNPSDSTKVDFMRIPAGTAKIHVYEADGAKYPAPAGTSDYLDLTPAQASVPWHPNRKCVDAVALDSSNKNIGTWYSSTPGGTRVCTSASPPPAPSGRGKGIAAGCNSGGGRTAAGSTQWQSVQDLGCMVLRFESGDGDGDANTYSQLAKRDATGLPLFTNLSASALRSYLNTYKDNPGFSGVVSFLNEPYGDWSTPHYATGGQYYEAVRPALLAAHAAGVKVILDADILHNDGTSWPQHMLDAAASHGDNFDDLVYGLDIHPYTDGQDPSSTTSPGLKYQLGWYNDFLHSKGLHTVLWLTELGCASAGTGSNTCGSEAAQQAWYAAFANVLKDSTGYARRVRAALQFTPNDNPFDPSSDTQEKNFGLIRGFNPTDPKKPAWATWRELIRHEAGLGANGNFR